MTTLVLITLEALELIHSCNPIQEHLWTPSLVVALNSFSKAFLFFSHSNHVLTEDIIFREVTPTNCLMSRRLLTKTSRGPRWMERYLPKQMASSAYIIEDSIVDPQKRTMTTLTWNISHARLMVQQRLFPQAPSVS